MHTIFLVGYRACGKTTVAKALAKSGVWQALDTDALLVEKAQSDIASIVQKHGWDYFRDLECEIMHNLSSVSTVSSASHEDSCHASAANTEELIEKTYSTKRIIATGGGIILREENRNILKSMSKEQKAITVFLDLPVETIVARLTKNPLHGQRPSLTDSTLTDEVAQVLADRMSLYKDVADVILDARRPIKDLVASIEATIMEKIKK